MFLLLCSTVWRGFELYFLCVLLNEAGSKQLRGLFPSGLMMPSQIMLSRPDLQGGTSCSVHLLQRWISRLPWQAKLVLYVMRRGAVKCEGMRARGKRKQRELVHPRSLGRKRKEWWLWATPQSPNLLAAVTTKPESALEVVFGIPWQVLFSGTCKQ